MRVHIVGPTSPALLALASLFEARGDVVSHSDQAPSDAELYFFGAGHEAMKRLAHGLVVLDLRDDVDLSAAWTPFADLCLVRDTLAKMVLVETYGCEPERIFVVSDDDGHRLVNLVTQAWRDALPPATVEKRGEPMDDSQSAHDQAAALPAQQVATLTARVETLERQADVMLRGYQVRSHVPFIGPLIAWVRRNLTSHLREPYVDPSLERQVALNRELVVVLRAMLRLQTDLEARLARLEEERDHD